MPSSLDSERFWARITKDASGCWLWPSLKPNGYGQVYVGRLPMYAHRAAWTLTNGEIPDGLFVCHVCDVRACVNPAHLFLGTASDNTRDSVRKGRWIPRGCYKKRDAHV